MGVGVDATQTERSEAIADQAARRFRGVPVATKVAPQGVSDGRLLVLVAHHRHQPDRRAIGSSLDGQVDAPAPFERLIPVLHLDVPSYPCFGRLDLRGGVRERCIGHTCQEISNITVGEPSQHETFGRDRQRHDRLRSRDPSPGASTDVSTEAAHYPLGEYRFSKPVRPSIRSMSKSRSIETISRMPSVSAATTSVASARSIGRSPYFSTSSMIRPSAP